MSYQERRTAATEREAWRNMAALEQNSIGRVEDHRRRHHRPRSIGHSPDSSNGPAYQTFGTSFPGNSSLAQLRLSHAPPPDLYAEDSLPDEPPPSYEDSQAQAQAREPESLFQNLSLQGNVQRQGELSEDTFNVTNSRRYDVSTQLDQLRRSAPTPSLTQPEFALLEHATRFAGPDMAKQTPSSALRLRRPFLIPSASTSSSSAHCFPVIHPMSFPFVARTFHTFITNLNILLPLLYTDPIVHTYISRLNLILFNPCNFHISLVPTQDLAATLFERDPSYIEVSRALRAEAALLAHKQITSLEPWVEVVDPSLPSSSVITGKGNTDTEELRRLRDQVTSERRAASQLASGVNRRPSKAGFRAAASPNGPDIWPEWNAGNREPDHVSEEASNLSHANPKSPHSHDHDDAGSLSSVSTSSASSSSSSDDHRRRRDRKHDRKWARRADKFQRKLNKIERRAVKETRKGKKSADTVRREKERAVERLERKRMRKEARRGKRMDRGRGDRDTGGVDMVEGTLGEGKRVLWLVIQNAKTGRGVSSTSSLPF